MEDVGAPRPFERRLRWTWIVAQPRYALIFLRELTAFFILTYLVLFVILLHKAGQDARAYQDYLDFLWNPGMVVFHFVAAAAALWHTWTWFMLTPKSMVLWLRGWRVPGFALVASQTGAWAVLTALIILWVWWVGAL